MNESPAEKEERLRREGVDSWMRERGTCSGGGYSTGSAELDGWEPGWKQAHNLFFAPDTSRSMTCNWRPGKFSSSPAQAPDQVNQYELLKGRAKARR